MATAEQLVREVVAQPRFQRAPQIEDLPARLGYLRHVRVLATNASDGGRAALLPVPSVEREADRQAYVPLWFASIVNVEDVRREMQIVLEGRHIGSVIIIGHAADEIAEVWRETKDLVLVALVLGLAVLIILHFALGRLLRPLVSVAGGLRELERGEFRHRLALPDIPELAEITDRFNALALRLGSARSENQQLSRRLLTIQDDERRRIASELHDELGPCLFGIKADAASLDLLARRLPAKVAKTVRERTATIEEITDKIQLVNRRLLDRLRPMALDHLPLSEVIGGLVSEFQRHGPMPRITLSAENLAVKYDYAISITIYRCVQEGITNVLRHAQARNLEVELKECPIASQDKGSREIRSVLYLSLTDDGTGPPSDDSRGLGLTSMEERVRALGGEICLGANPDGHGTCLKIWMPLESVGPRPFEKRPLEARQR
ncbi:histidine kinase [Allomesorhizobium alhagi]|nr:histidine kinase [Mesorhizobium alhagi]